MRRLFLIAALFLWTPAGAQNDDATPRKIEKETFVYAVRDADTLRLDRYALLSPDSRAKPCLMFLFGGGFMTGTRDNRRFRPFFDYYARKGFVVVSIDYRLGMKRARQAGLLDEEHFTQALDMTLSMATEDLYDATAYICRHMPDVDPSRIVTCGSSAGAITVLMGEYWLCNGHPLTAGKSIADDLARRRVPHAFYSVAETNHSMAWRPMTENRGEIDSFLEKLVFKRQRLVTDVRITPLDAPAVPKDFGISDYIDANYGR